MEPASWLVVGMATRRCRSARKPPSSKYLSARSMAPSRVPVMGFLAWCGRKIAKYHALGTRHSSGASLLPAQEKIAPLEWRAPSTGGSHAAERAHRFHQDGRGGVRHGGGADRGRAGQ